MKKEKHVRYFQICPHCGDDAWEYVKKPYTGMLLTDKSIIHSGNPLAGDPISCQKCHKPIHASQCNKNTLREKKYI
jgi:hypothetical protein